jgi:hypothetical protein
MAYEKIYTDLRYKALFYNEIADVERSVATPAKSYKLLPCLWVHQSQVDAAPLFPEALVKLEAFLVNNGLNS